MAEQSICEQELALLRLIADRGSLTVGEAADQFGAPRGLARSRISNEAEHVTCAATSQYRPGMPFPKIAINAAVIARYDAVSVVVRRAKSTGGIGL